MGGASLWLQTVTITPGGHAEFMPGADGEGTQLDDQDLGELHPGHCTDDCRFGADVKRWTDGELRVLPLDIRLGFSGRDGARTSAAEARGGRGGQHGERVSGAAGGAAEEGAAGLLSSVHLRTEAGGARPRRGCGWCAVGGSVTTTRW